MSQGSIFPEQTRKRDADFVRRERNRLHLALTLKEEANVLLLTSLPTIGC